MTMGVYTSAVANLLIPTVGAFKVTPKGGTDEGGLRVLGMLRLLTFLTVALVAAAAIRLLTVADVLQLPSMPRFATVATLVIAVFELSIIFVVLRALARHRQRRNAFRFPVDMVARRGDRIVRVVDLNLHGAALVMSVDEGEAVRVGDEMELNLQLLGLDGRRHATAVTTRIRSVEEGAPERRAHTAADDSGGKPQRRQVRAGVAFESLSQNATMRILEYCHVLLPAQGSAGAVLAEGEALRGEATQDHVALSS